MVIGQSCGDRWALQMQSFATIVTLWIDGTGVFVDIKDRLGRLGDDVAAYALHTLGWVRIIQIAGYSEFGFDARSVHAAAFDAMVDAIERQSRANSLHLLRVEVFDGQEWQHQTSADPRQVVRFAQHVRTQVAGSTETTILHQIPYSIDRIWGLGDPQIRAVADAWRASSGVLSATLDTAITRDCPDRSVKVMVPAGTTFRFDRYRSSRTGPWDRTVWNGFQGNTVQSVVPDPVLAQAVTRTGELVLRSGLPRLERCRGPVLASDGLRDFAWYRLSLPVWRPGDNLDGTPFGVLTVLSPDWREDEAA